MDTTDELIKIIATFGLLGAALGFIIGTSAYNFIRSITENLIVPLIGAFFKVDDLQEASLQINGSEVKIGELFLSFIDISLVILVIYVLFRLFRPHIQSITQEKSRTDQRMLEQNEEIIRHLRQINQKTV